MPGIDATFIENRCLALQADVPAGPFAADCRTVK
jgi:hypothetical protein